MLVKELRIGNYILGNYMDYGDFEEAEKQEICEVLSLNSVGVCEYSIWVEGESSSVEHYDSFDPIPLTEEWIAKLGISNNGRNIYSKQGEIDICVNAKLVYIGGCDLPLNNQYFQLKCEYVHQLQNLYFTLTGQELTIK